MDGVKYWNGGQVFCNDQFGEIRSLTIKDAPWWVGKDVAAALGYANPRKALIDHVDPEDKGVTKRDTLGGEQELTIINESGLYSLILSSKLPTAKAFKRWVTSEVLPAIRQHGISKAISSERIRAPVTPVPVNPFLVKPTPAPVPVGPVPTTATYQPPVPAKRPEISVNEALKAVELIVKCKADRLSYVLEILRRTGFDFPDPERG